MLKYIAGKEDTEKKEGITGKFEAVPKLQVLEQVS
jgi:hypothetical protein